MKPDVLAMLEPPPGGLAGLRVRLERRRQRRWAFGTSLLVAAAVALLLVLRPAPATALPPDAGLVALGLEAAPTAPVRSLTADVALHQVATASPDVVFYRVGHL